jgi:uncharacterized protein
MIIDIDRLPKEGLVVSKEYEFFGEDLVEENTVFLEPVRAELSIKRIGEEVFIKGEMRVRLSFVCSRCLVPFEFPIQSKFDLVYLPEELDVMKDQLESDDMSKLFYYSRKIDIKDVVLEQLNLAIPVKPLCSEDCQGICAVCGKIIRNNKCSCSRKNSDPRLEKLRIFIRDKK